MITQRKRTKVAGRVFSCRADEELAEWAERYSYEEEITESQLLIRALRLYRKTVAEAPGAGDSPGAEVRQKRRDEAILFQARLTNRYLYQLLTDRYGEDQVEACSTEVKQDVAREVREIVRAIDDGGEG